MQPSSRSDVTAMYPVSKSSSRSDVTAMYPVSKSSSRSDVTAMYPVSKSPSRSDVTAVHPVSKSSSRADVTAIYSAGSDRAKIFITKSQMILCKLCLSDVQTDELYAFEHCKCTFCLSCVKEYLKVWITEGNVMSMRCPDGACKKQGVIGSPEIEKLVPQELFDRYNRLRFEREVDSDPNRTFCSRAGCEAVCVVSGRPAGAMTSPRGHPVQCPTCGYLFCVMCKEEWHADQTCDENMQLNQGPGGSDGIPFSSAEDAKIKRCPICRIPIERNDGCAQMMCKRCKHVFCWYCLASLDDDILLRHYDKGKCKNRLGHSRASVIWHRTQVVGIFAGFGVLLLVASPFLLLAAPCILCCKCKACHVGEEDDMDAMPSTTT